MIGAKHGPITSLIFSSFCNLLHLNDDHHSKNPSYRSFHLRFLFNLATLAIFLSTTYMYLSTCSVHLSRQGIYLSTPPIILATTPIFLATHGLENIFQTVIHKSINL